MRLGGGEAQCVIGWRGSSLWLGGGGAQCVAHSGAGYRWPSVCLDTENQASGTIFFYGTYSKEICYFEQKKL